MHICTNNANVLKAFNSVYLFKIMKYNDVLACIKIVLNVLIINIMDKKCMKSKNINVVKHFDLSLVYILLYLGFVDFFFKFLVI